MYLKVPKSSIIETKPEEHATKIGVGGELGAALNMYFRGPFHNYNNIRKEFSRQLVSF
jgi:hypothetical protein